MIQVKLLIVFITSHPSFSTFSIQLSPKKVVSLAEVEQKWKDNCLPKERLQNLMQIGSFGDEFDWLKFFALACSALAGVSQRNLSDIIQNISSVTRQPATILPAEIFLFFSRLSRSTLVSPW